MYRWNIYPVSQPAWRNSPTILMIMTFSQETNLLLRWKKLVQAACLGARGWVDEAKAPTSLLMSYENPGCGRRSYPARCPPTETAI